MYKENSVLWTVKLACKTLCISCCERPNVVGSTQYVMAERMTAKYHVLELVVNQLRWAVIVTLNLITYYLHFFVNLTLWVCRVEYNISKKVDGTGHMLFENSRIVNGIFLICKGVKVASNTL